MKCVYVMLSTYNGEQYIEQQIDSILSQKEVAVQLLIRDDGSTDGTIEILRKYEQQRENIVLYEGENIGYIRSFLWLVSQCPIEEEAYYAFSDQDDIWDEDKLSASIAKIKGEKAQGAVLYYSDLKVVDKEGNYIRRANNWEGRITKYMISVFIGIRGCTMVYNGELQKLLCIDPIEEVSGHDTYIALVAFWLGKVVYDEIPHINYRQTGANLSITGLSKWDCLKKNFVFFKRRMTSRGNIHEKNAKELLRHYGREKAEKLEDLVMVADYKKNFTARMQLLFCSKYKEFSLPIRLFNDFMIIFGKL